ncbi:MAG TPA: 6-bladed beta-propeller [Longimicrobiales bacterium]|nr:6-bladed beta-propeller [Longimicrobiales bacterium]
MMLPTVATAFGACADPSSRQTPEHADSPGINVTAPSADRQLPWHFEQLWRLGPADDDRLTLVDLARHLIAADSAGRIFILDEAARHVLVISTGGEVIATIGRQGEGPGELKEPIALTTTEAAVSVYDFGKQALVRWSHTGDVLPELRIPNSFWGPLIREIGNDTVLFTALARADASTSEQSLVAWSHSGQRQLAAMTRQPDRSAEFPSCGVSGPPIAPLFAPELVWDAAGSRVAVNTSPEYRVDVFETGEHVLSIRRDMPPRRVTRALALAEVADGMPIPIADCTVPAHEVVQGRGNADVLPSVRDVVLAPHGELWVLRGTFRGEPTLIDVFGADGTYRGTLPPESPFPAAFLPTDEIVAIEHDALGAASVAL